MEDSLSTEGIFVHIPSSQWCQGIRGLEKGESILKAPFPTLEKKIPVEI